MSQIKAFLFDMDGTLVQTERLKALSYAKAAVTLSPNTVKEEEVIEAFKEVVGRSRFEVAEALLNKFSLHEAARNNMAATETASERDAFIKIRLGFYSRMIDDPLVIQKSMWTHNIAQLYNAMSQGYKTGLATMSHREQASRILDVLSLTDCFDFIATRDDVQKGKPDPEIYHLVISALKVKPEQCLVFEDSVSGVTAALAAGMHVIAVSTPFTRNSLEQANLLPREQLVHDPQVLPALVDRFLSQTRSELAA
ncbi:MAG: HAD family hydrolase [Rhodothermales bacterium]